MNIQVAVLCDAAAQYGGKLCLLGAFDTITARKLPAVHPQCAIALRMTFDQIEAGPHHVRISFMDADGNLIIKNLEASLRVAVPPGAMFVSTNLIVNVQQIKFEAAGQYLVNVAVDGRQEKEIPLRVHILPGNN